MGEQQSIGFGACGKRAFSTDNVEGSTTLIRATARNYINVIAKLARSLLLRIHSRVAFDRTYDSAAP